MTTRKITIKTCQACPHIATYDALDVDNAPFCNKTEKGLDLPFVTRMICGNRMAVASPTYVIPDWCPLEADDGVTLAFLNAICRSK